MRGGKHALVSRLVTVAAVATVGLVGAAAPAAAADDGFAVTTKTPSLCEDRDLIAGYLQFIDYGPGAPGGGNNDDYLSLEDWCADGDGVKGWAWLNGILLGERYNGNGTDAAVLWDPFPPSTVRARDVVGLKVCSVNGPNGTPYNCQSAEIISLDG
ncbi:hypothetical protein [Plantactinospora sp. CA-290183]|uniref:hypothetical protein n=1 Tax=Plantactinospora sp. CA-290183 TaxID=3240006 RepID=UPI003D90CB09